MPEERIYTIRGKRGPGISHHQLQLSSYDPHRMYQIIEFKIMPAGNPTQADCYGIISMGKNDNIDPSDPDFSNQNEIAWSHHAVTQPVPPGIVESVSFYNYEINDEKLFNYNIWIHTKDALHNPPAHTGEDINYFLKIKRYDVGAVQGSIGSLRQNQYRFQESQ